jgi:DNA-binding CsgD family transcriptional regulator
MNPPRPPKPASGLPVKIPGGAKPVSPPSAPGGNDNSPAAEQQDSPDDTGSRTGITVPRLTQFSSLGSRGCIGRAPSSAPTGAARRSRDSTALIEVVTGRDGVARCGQQLFKRAEWEIRGIDAPPYAQASDGGRVSSASALAGRNVRSRFIHARDTLSRPGVVARLEVDITAGEDIRFLPEAPMKLIIADDQAALIPLLATPQVLDACILVRPSALLDALSALFESLWEQAQLYIPVRPVAIGPNDIISNEERRIISLLAMGMSDETISRQLGISHRTVQRRVQALLVRLGAASRCQAGVLAASRGWWQPDRDRPDGPLAVSGALHPSAPEPA